MKWTAVTLDLSKPRKIAENAGILSRTFALLFIGCVMFFILLGLGSYAQSKLNSSPVSSMKGLAASVSKDFFLDVMGMEIPRLKEGDKPFTFSDRNMFSFVFRLITDINPKDPKTLLAREVPGLVKGTPVLLRTGKGTDVDSGPQDYSPSKTPPGQGEAVSQPPSPPSGAASPAPSEQNPAPGTASAQQKDIADKVVMFYHSHNRESFIPELNVKDPDKAFDANINITLVGKRMAQKLEQLGIGAVDYATDYETAEKKYVQAFSYKYSQKTVKEAFAAHPDLKFLFDLHRDSLGREKTTVSIDGKDYAQVYFIIGEKNPNWRKNESFANRIQEQLEKKKPGISRGIWGKTPLEGNAEYNQTLSPNSVLIEIGGPYNSLDECYRTADVLAETIADVYRNAEKADAPVAAKASKS